MKKLITILLLFISVAAQSQISTATMISNINDTVYQNTTHKITGTGLNGILKTLVSYINGHTSSSTGTVTSFTVTTANGVSATVANSTTTPNATFTLGAITPTSVNGVVVSGSSTPTLAVTGTSTIAGTHSGTSSGTNTGDQTNISGNAATVTTNASLTGPITSVGNATSIASQTGTGSVFVVQTSPTFVTKATSPEFDVSGTGGAGFINLVAQSSNTSAPSASGFNLFAGSTGSFNWVRKNGSDTYVRTFDAALTSDRTYTLPDATTTVMGTDVTQTVTNKRITKRAGTTTSSATPTINTDNVDYYSITALAAAITSFTTNLSGTPSINDKLWIAITDNGTARALTWGASFEASGTIALPTTTVISTRLDVGFVWNEITSKWRIVAVQ